MLLPGEEKKKLQAAFLAAFPTKSQLAQMVQFGLDENLDIIAGGENLGDIVFHLINWAESNGSKEQLF
jgi:hypothetical protein